MPERDYESPWRPNHEALAVALWLGLGAIAGATADRWALDPRPFRAFALLALLMTLTWLPGMVRVLQRHARLPNRFSHGIIAQTSGDAKRLTKHAR